MGGPGHVGHEEEERKKRERERERELEKAKELEALEKEKRKFHTLAPQQVLEDFRNLMHNADLADLARENAEYITTHLQGAFPDEVVMAAQ